MFLETDFVVCDKSCKACLEFACYLSVQHVFQLKTYSANYSAIEYENFQVIEIVVAFTNQAISSQVHENANCAFMPACCLLAQFEIIDLLYN